MCVYQKKSRLSTTLFKPDAAQSTPLRTIFSGYSASLPLTDPSHAIFLDYFVADASSAMSCHETIRQDTCRAVVSVGAVFPGLLYSGLLFAALHKASRVSPHSRCKQLDIRIMELRAAALSLLQESLHGSDHANSAAVIATTLMLATCELQFDPDAKFWRTHFEYAGRLISDGRRRGIADKTASPDLWRLIDRQFAVMEFLVSLPAPWTSTSALIGSQSCLQDLPLVDSIGIIDGNLACTKDLLEVFQWIKALQDMRTLLQDYDVPEFKHVAAHCVRSEASELVAIVHRMMARDNRNPATLSKELAGHCDETMTEAYRMANTVAHHIALICLYRYGLEIGREAAVVEDSVASIVQLANAMPKRDGLHPSIVLTTALFVAGCEANATSQSDIRSLLQAQFEITRNQSAQRTLEKLERVWRIMSGDGSLSSSCFPAGKNPHRSQGI